MRYFILPFFLTIYNQNFNNIKKLHNINFNK